MKSQITMQALHALNQLGILAGMLINDGYIDRGAELIDYMDELSTNVIQRLFAEEEGR